MSLKIETYEQVEAISCYIESEIDLWLKHIAEQDRYIIPHMHPFVLGKESLSDISVSDIEEKVINRIHGTLNVSGILDAYENMVLHEEYDKEAWDEVDE